MQVYEFAKLVLDLEISSEKWRRLLGEY